MQTAQDSNNNISDSMSQAKITKELADFKAALDQHAIVAMTDAEGSITYVNDKFCEISKYSREELIGQNHRILNSGYHPQAFFEELWQTVNRGKIWKGEIKNQAKNGTHYWVRSTIVPIVDALGKPVQYISIRTDITDRKLAEQALIVARDEADRANTAKSQFLSSMSHELRTPMNSILGFSQLLLCNDALSDEHKDYVSEILTAGGHLLELINDVLDLAKVESGRFDLSVEAVEVSAVVDECFSLISNLAGKRSIQMSHGDLKGVTVRADRTRLKQALLNLLSNAVKYNRAGGSVKLKLEKSGDKDRIRILVSDTGPGIPADRLSEVFQPFNRLDADSTGIEGTGIGLTITRRIVEMMNGTVDVMSKVGVGSTFWIEVPLESTGEIALYQNETNEVRKVPPAEIHSITNRTALYVEDNPSNIKLVTHLFGQRRNIQLLTALTPELGIELALTRDPDLILLDINMPGMDGFQVLKKLKTVERLKDVPIVAVTANAMSRDIDRGLAAGFTEYLTKPLNVVKFFTVIDQLIGSDTHYEQAP